MKITSQNWIQSGETIKYWGESRPQYPFRIALLCGVVFVLLKAVLIVWAYEYTNFPSLVRESADVFLTGTLFVYLVLCSIGTEVVLTNSRLAHRRRFFVPMLGGVDEIPIAEITEIRDGNSDNGLFEVVLKGGVPFQISRLPNLGQLRNALDEVVAAK